MAIHFKAYLKSISKNRLKIIITIIGSMLALFGLSYLAAYLLQDGDIHLRQHIYLDNVYFDMWKHLIHLDVTSDKKAIGPEAFIVNGKTIAYFLPFPALVRGILSIIHLGNYSALSMLLGFLIFVIFSAKTFLLAVKAVTPEAKIDPAIKFGWLIFIAFGSPFLSIMENSSTYWEAIVWGVAMYMICMYLSAALLSRTRNVYLLTVFSIVCGLTLFTRPTFTVGACVIFSSTILMLFLNSLKSSNNEPQRPIYSRLELTGILTIFVLFGISLGALNFARWGNPFEFQPLAKNIQYMGNSRETDFKKYGALQLDRIPENISYYFLPSKDNFSSQSPFIQAGSMNYFAGFAKNFDYREPTLPIPIILPVYFLLTVFGLIIFIRNAVLSLYKRGDPAFPSSLLPAAISAFVPGIMLLPYTAQAMRYAGDFTPGIILFSIYAIAIIVKYSASTDLQRPAKRKIIITLNLLGIGILLFASLYMTTAGLLIQRKYFSNSWFGPGQSAIVSRFPTLFSEITFPTSYPH